MLRKTAAVIAALSSACLLSAAALSPAAATPRPRKPAPAMPRRAGVQLVKDLRRAWQITKGQGVTVAIIGGHVDPAAPGLSGKVITGRGFGNYRHAARYDSTVIASAVAGSGPSQQNPFGTIGLAPAARILSVRVEPARSGWQDIISAAIRYSVNRGAKVIYVDVMGYYDTVSLDSAVAYAVSKNAVIIGNEVGFGRKPNSASYPNSLPGVLGAGTVIIRGLTPPQRRRRPVTNDSVLVAAPGNALVVTGPHGERYLIYNSYAANAWLTATVALLKSVYHGLSPALVEQALALSARNHPRDGYNIGVGYGLINPAGALREAAQLRRLRPVAQLGPGAVSPADRLDVGPAPGPINAVRHPLWKLAGGGGAVVAGLVLLAFAAARWRRRVRSAPRRGVPTQRPAQPSPDRPARSWPAAGAQSVGGPAQAPGRRGTGGHGTGAQEPGWPWPTRREAGGPGTGGHGTGAQEPGWPWSAGQDAGRRDSGGQSPAGR